ncbi:MAG: PorV/PorQ family protein [bacterium]|nr:PorV/PorQ family protein [bacterium]
MTMIKKGALAVAIMGLMASTTSFGQAGGAAVPFLLISPDARASGMGDVGTAIADDVNAVFWNPAGLGFQNSRQIALSFSKWLPQFNADLFYSYGTYGQYIEAIDGTIAGTMIFMNLGEFTRTAPDGTALGKFRSNEFALGVSYGTHVAEDLCAGIQIKYIQSNLAPAGPGQAGAGVGISGAFDLGFLWKPDKLTLFGQNFDNVLGLGINLQNVGPKVTYLNESDPLPTTLRIGVAFKLVEDEFNDLLISADFAKLLVRRDALGSDPIPVSFVTSWGRGGLETGVGLEYVYDQIVALRGGYFTEPQAAGNRQYFTLGAGVKYELFKLDFSYILTIEENHPLANTLRFSLLVDWGTEG